MERHLNENIEGLRSSVKTAGDALGDVSNIIVQHGVSSTIDEKFLM